MTQAIFHMNEAKVLLVLPLAAILCACDPVAAPQRSEIIEPGVLAATRVGPPGAAEGTCWERTVSPAVVQTVTRQVRVKAADVNPDGTIGALPEYRSEETQEIVTPRVDNWFETPCDSALTMEFYETLQRALAAREYYAGPITGQFDANTRDSAQAYQVAIGGPDSPVLALSTARSLGLIAVPRTPSE